MREFGKYMRLIAVTLVAAVMSSCRTELCYDHYRELSLDMNYEFEWERDYGMQHIYNWDSDTYGLDYNSLRPGLPEWLVAIRYKGDERPEEHYFGPTDGKMIIDGTEDEAILVYNGDTEYILLSDMASLPGARASATGRSRASLESMKAEFPGSRSTNPPDVLYSAYIRPLPDVQLHESRVHPVKMQPLVFTYLIRYEFEYGLQHVALARGALGGMAETIYLRDGSTPDNTAIILYDCEKKAFGCQAAVRSFGVPGFDDKYFGRRRDARDTKDADKKDAEPRYMLNLEVMLTSGKILEFDFDITDQMTYQPRGGVITVSGIRIEDEENPEPTGGGFDADLSDWGDADVIELPVGPSH